MRTTISILIIIPRLLVALVALTALAMAAECAPVLSFVVHGKVQGVFFRKYTQKRGAELGLRGWCENTAEGTVRGEAHGDAKALDDFKHYLRHVGSPKSKIERAVLGTADIDPATLPLPFAIRK